LQQFHRFSDSAAPIFDLTGSVLGALGVLSFARNAHPHSLGLVAAGARAIESQRQADHLLGEQNSQLAGLNAILSTISEGILVWNREGVVIHANPAATHLLDLSEDALRGARIESTVKFPAYIEQALAAQEVVSDVEANLAIQDRSINCVLSLRYVGHSKGQQATIAILRRTQEVRQLVQRQFGAQMVFTLDHLVGRSAEIQSVRRSAQIAAAARASVLIYGESGTGKNLLAHAIHNHGPQRDGPFIILACTAIPSELILTELSGLEEGADGRRSGGRPGKFELADGGTILFKDIEALPLEAQAVLLNVLELGIVQRLGSRRPIQVNVRVIAITTHNLRQAVQEGRFRSELFYRLSPFEISLPPLRERFGDLPLLVNSFLERINRQQDQPVRVSPEAMVILQEHHWPGNIRELESVLAQAALRAGSLGQILPEHLPDFVRFPEKHAEEEKRLIPLDEVERLALLKAARACKGNVSLMARSLGIGRTTVWRRLKQLDISPDQFREN
jgi:transcriptional activator for dhaKLM operon